ncbi:cupin domain-containing protein [Nonlabens ulvanivorans]|uniref:cupin domain-containing protein n=1 Tax=Nonlabens ulvanivorans TaxID=906888 RepID=UPI0029421B09|nr:cupin domain-containing protein [Nonlabens ulvanivorans]WOI24177.1 cupin domain-containing protein [Nonlabens ulvanivorans]
MECKNNQTISFFSKASITIYYHFIKENHINLFYFYSMGHTYINPITKERATILKTSAQTDGAFTYIEVELQPGGGNPIHYHQYFTEQFEPIEGTLGVHHLGKEIRLKPGQIFKVPVIDNHRFYNPGDRPIVFRAKLEPGQPGFENFMAALFGLVSDGKTFGKNQIPFNPFYAIILLKWGDTQVDSLFFKLFKSVLMMLYTLSRKLGYEKKLLHKYIIG